MISMKLKLVCVFVFFVFLTNAQKNSSQINGKFSDGVLTIQQYADNIFKLTYHTAGYIKNEQMTDAVVLHPMSVVNSSLVHWKNGAISFGKDEKAVLVQIKEKAGYQVLQFRMGAAERIYGGGERALPLNRRGYRFNLYNNPWYGYGEGADNLNYSVPFFTSSAGYGLFFDNGSRGYADLGKTNTDILEAGFISGEINVFIILGNNNQDILTAYQRLTGNQPLPPYWVMGNLMSRFGYTSEEQVKSIASSMKKEGMPVDGIIYDLFWFGDSIKGGLGNLDWINTKNWPDPKKMMADFKKDHINTILITEPFMVQDTRQYTASLPYLAKDSAGKPYIIPDFYFGKGGLLDIFRKDAGDWIWNIHYKKQIENGVDGWWTDLGEPEKHPSDMLHNGKDEGVNRLLGADEVHNIYGHYWNKNLFEHYASAYPNKRLFHLNRSGFSGSPRYSIFPWTGDVSRSWSGFRAQLPNLLSMSMSGVPFIHSDAGGFGGGSGDNELYIRWLQFAAYTPVFRPHGTALYEIDKNAFSFPSEAALIDTPYRAIARRVISSRYAMLPYNYTLAYRQAKYGEPLMRPLYYAYSADSTAVATENEYNWGTEILVAPVLQKAAVTRSVYFPEGKWYSKQENKFYEGKQTTSCAITLNDIPVFYKEGSFIPTYAENGNTNTIARNFLSILYVPSGKTSAYTLYEDDGESKKAISSQQYILTEFIASGIKNNELLIRIKTEGKGYTGKPGKRLFRWEMPLDKKPESVLVDNQQITVSQDKTKIGVPLKYGTAFYDPKSHILTVYHNFEGQSNLKIILE